MSTNTQKINRLCGRHPGNLKYECNLKAAKTDNM